MDPIESRIRTAINEAQARGVRLIAGDWGVYNSHAGFAAYKRRGQDCACALGCVLLVEDTIGIDYTDQELAAAEHLGVSMQWVRGFIEGFDGISRQAGADKGAHALGVRLRVEYNLGAPPVEPAPVLEEQP